MCVCVKNTTFKKTFRSLHILPGVLTIPKGSRLGTEEREGEIPLRGPCREKSQCQYHQLHPKSMELICSKTEDGLQGVRIFSRRRVRFLSKGNAIKSADGSPNSPVEGCKIQEVELGWHKTTFWILGSQHLSWSLKWDNLSMFLHGER